MKEIFKNVSSRDVGGGDIICYDQQRQKTVFIFKWKLVKHIVIVV